MPDDMVSRYWRVSAVGLGLGFVSGAALFGIMVVSGNSDWRGYLTVRDVVRSIAWYGFFGFLVALAAIAGGWISVAAFDRRLEKQSGRRVSLAAGGAAAGTIVLGVVAGALQIFRRGFTHPMNAEMDSIRIRRFLIVEVIVGNN